MLNLDHLLSFVNYQDQLKEAGWELGNGAVWRGADPGLAR
jgi:hypothetical protein